MSNEDVAKNDEELAIEPEKDEAIEGIAEVPQQLLDKLPPEVKQQITTFLLSHQRIGLPAQNPLASKITSEHIDKIIDNSDKDSERDFKARWFTLAYALLALGFLVFLFIYLPTVDKALFLEVLKLILTFLGGLGTGFGISKLKKKEE